MKKFVKKKDTQGETVESRRRQSGVSITQKNVSCSSTSEQSSMVIHVSFISKGLTLGSVTA